MYLTVDQNTVLSDTQELLLWYNGVNLWSFKQTISARWPHFTAQLKLRIQSETSCVMSTVPVSEWQYAKTFWTENVVQFKCVTDLTAVSREAFVKHSCSVVQWTLQSEHAQSLNWYGAHAKVYFHCAHTWKLPDGVYPPVNVQTAAHHVYGLLWLDPILVKAKTVKQKVGGGRVSGSVCR